MVVLGGARGWGHLLDQRTEIKSKISFQYRPDTEHRTQDLRYGLVGASASHWTISFWKKREGKVYDRGSWLLEILLPFFFHPILGARVQLFRFSLELSPCMIGRR